MDRLIIESTEGRITLGIVMFVAIMILVGWVAINEPARMAEFVEQHEARSIERGAELFAANCSSCHGNNGYGGIQAPALNNPHLFGYSYLDDVNSEIAGLERELAELVGVEDVFGIPDQVGTLELLETQRNELLEQVATVSDEEARDLLVELGHIDARLDEDAEQVAMRLEGIEDGILLPADANDNLTESELATREDALLNNVPVRIETINTLLNGDGTEENIGLYAQREQQLEELAPAITAGYLPQLEENIALAEEYNYPLFITNYITVDGNRLSQISFGGTLEDYLTTTLIHGRPGSGTVWDGSIMSAWSQRAGGSLRDDQIGDLVSYILNYDQGSDWTVGDFNAVGQYAKIHTQYTGVQEGSEQGLGVNVDDIVANLPEGDVMRGEALYYGNEASTLGNNLACTSCHLGGAVGPAMAGTWTRVENIRLAELEGYTGVEYLVEAIVAPNDYIVAGYSSGVMPQNYGTQMTLQDMADIVAFLETQNQ